MSREGDAHRKGDHSPLRLHQGHQPVKGKQSCGELRPFATSCVALFFFLQVHRDHFLHVFVAVTSFPTLATKKSVCHAGKKGTRTEIWMLHDTGPAVTVCPESFQNSLGCVAPVGAAVILGGKRKLPSVIVQRSFYFKFLAASVTKLTASADDSRRSW